MADSKKSGGSGAGRSPRMDLEEKGDRAPMEMMSEFLTLVTVETLTEESARRALSISAAILRIEPTNKLIREYQKTLNQFIEQKKYEAKNGDEDEEEEEDDESEEDEDDEEEDDESEGETESKG